MDIVVTAVLGCDGKGLPGQCQNSAATAESYWVFAAWGGLVYMRSQF